MRIVITTLSLIVFASLYGCGLKGPLYLPEPAKAVEPAASPNQSAESLNADRSNDPSNDEADADKKKTPAQPAPDTTR